MQRDVLGPVGAPTTPGTTTSGWVAPQAWLSFIELDKAVVLV